MSPEQLQEKVVPLCEFLANSQDWWAPRVSACGLIAVAYSGWTAPGDDDKRKQVVDTFRVSRWSAPVSAAAVIAFLIDLGSLPPLKEATS